MTVYLNFIAKASSITALLRTLFIMLGFGLLLSACASTTTAPLPYPGPNQPPVTQRPDPNIPGPKTPDPQTPDTKIPDTKRPVTTGGLTPPFMDGAKIKRVAILLPFSAKSSRLREEANSMLRAAEMALFAREDHDVLLIAHDSKGSVEGAKQAARKAVSQGADIILGPILAKSVAASGKIARKSGTPVIGFSTDTSVAGRGIYLLSFPPEAEVRRVTQFAAQSGATKFAFLGPDSVYGRRVLGAYREQVNDLGNMMNGVEIYAGKDISVMQEPAGKLAKLYTDLEAKNIEEGNPAGEAAYHAVLLPEGGTALRSLAPLLPFYDVHWTDVQFMGTGLWNREEVVREPSLNGGIFAGPDMEGKKAFNARYDAVYGEDPSRLATLAYDGLNIAAFVTGSDKKQQHKRLNDPAGFFGVDGLVRFNHAGAPERGLAIYQIKNGRFIIIDPAPRTTDGAF